MEDWPKYLFKHQINHCLKPTSRSEDLGYQYTHTDPIVEFTDFLITDTGSTYSTDPDSQRTKFKWISNNAVIAEVIVGSTLISNDGFVQ